MDRQPGQDGTATAQAHTAELTGLNQRLDNWNTGLRLIVRRTRPSARHTKNLTALERRTGWRNAIVATNIGRIPGTRLPPATMLDALHRVRTKQGHGPAEPALQRLDRQPGLALAANVAADLDAWTRLLGLHDQPDLVHAEPDTLRYRILHLPAKLATHARRRILSIPDT